MVIIRPDPDVFDPEFVYWLFRSNIIQNQILQLRSGTAQPQLPISSMQRLIIPVPALDVQRGIVNIVGTLQQKIELNQRINENLERQIKTLIKSWLVDYLPFGGAKPTGWITVPLSSIADFVPGYSYKGAELQPSTMAMATIKNFNRNGGLKLKGSKNLFPHLL